MTKRTVHFTNPRTLPAYLAARAREGWRLVAYGWEGAQLALVIQVGGVA